MRDRRRKKTSESFSLKSASRDKIGFRHISFREMSLINVDLYLTAAAAAAVIAASEPSEQEPLSKTSSSTSSNFDPGPKSFSGKKLKDLAWQLKKARLTLPPGQKGGVTTISKNYAAFNLFHKTMPRIKRNTPWWLGHGFKSLSLNPTTSWKRKSSWKILTKSSLPLRGNSNI